MHLGVPGRQPQRLGGHFHAAFNIVTLGSLDEGFQLPLLLGKGVKIRVRFGVGGVDLVQSRQRLVDAFNRFLDDLADGLGIVQFRLLGQVANIEAGQRPGFAHVVRLNAGHDPQQGRLARAVETEHADLGAGEETQVDVLEDLFLRGNDLAEAAHAEYVLSHGVDVLIRSRKMEAWFVRTLTNRCR